MVALATDPDPPESEGEEPHPLVCGKCGWNSRDDSGEDTGYKWKAVLESDGEGNEVTVLVCPVCNGFHSRHW